MPVLDVAAYLRGEPGELEWLADALRYACEQVGFYFLAGHGMTGGMIDDAFAAVQHFP